MKFELFTQLLRFVDPHLAVLLFEFYEEESNNIFDKKDI